MKYLLILLFIFSTHSFSTDLDGKGLTCYKIEANNLKKYSAYYFKKNKKVKIYNLKKIKDEIKVKYSNDLKYTKGLNSILKVNDTYQSISDDLMEHLQLFFDNNGILLPIFEIEQKVKLLDPMYKDVEFIIKEQLSTNRFILLTKLFNRNIKLTVTRDLITI